MSQPKILPALLWKEFRVVGPLVIGVVALASLVYVIAPVAFSSADGIYAAILVLFPNLVAFGVSAIQIGHEEEVGTLNWQRSLPVKLSSVLISKLVVAVCAVSITWLACLGWVGLAIQRGETNILYNDMIYMSGGVGPELFRLATFSGMLLACSFLASWMVRSAGLALVISAAVITVCAIAPSWLADVIGERVGLSQSSAGQSAAVAVMNIVVTTIFIAVGSWLAGRRWDRNKSGFTFSFAGVAKHPAYSPAVTAAQKTPRALTALLWQAARQACWPLAIAIALFAMVLIFNLYYDDSSFHGVFIPPSELLVIALLISSGIAGASAFAGDTMKQRYRFFADRGISRTSIWVTRVFVPCIVFVAVLVCFVAFSEQPSESLKWKCLAALTSFISGNLAAMWARKPIVGYLGGPLLTFVCVIVAGATFIFYEEYAFLSIFGLLVLAGCSYRMIRRWSEGDSGWAYNGRFVGWLGLAALAFIVPIFGDRLISTPPKMTAWRQEAFAEADRQLAVVEAIIEATPAEAQTTLQPIFFQPVYINGRRALREDDIKVLSQAFKDGERIKLYDAFSESLITYLLVEASTAEESPLPEFTREEVYQKTFELLFMQIDYYKTASWSSIYFSDFVDRLELLAASNLANDESKLLLGEDVWKQFAGKLRSRDERKKTRRQGLLLSWLFLNEYELRNLGEMATVDHKMPMIQFGFGSYRLLPKARAIFSFERQRCMRFVDLATRMSLNQLESSLPSQSSFDYANRMFRWHVTSGVQEPIFTFLNEEIQYRNLALVNIPTINWNAEFEQVVENVKRQVANEQEDTMTLEAATAQEETTTQPPVLVDPSNPGQGLPD